MSAPKPTPGTADISTLPLLDPTDAAAIFRFPSLFLRVVRAGWLRPVVQKPKVTLYARNDIDQAIARLIAGDYPPDTGGKNS